MSALRIIYMGTPDFAVAPLRALVEAGYNIAAVVTAEDKPAGRGLKAQESAVKKYAVEAGLRVLQPPKLRAPEFIAELRELKPDLGIVIAFRMLPEAVWSLPRLGTFNLHASLLPQYRGAAPINWAIINGEQVTGVTTFMLNSEIDKGDIIGRREVAIGPDENAGSLHDRLMEAGTALVLESVKLVAQGAVTPLPQTDSADLKPAPKIFKETCRIDWCASADSIHNKIRGLSPYPGAWSEMTCGSETMQVKIYESAKEHAPHNMPCGTIADAGNLIKVACADGYISIKDLQLSGKKRMGAGDFLRGFKEIGRFRFL